MGRVPLFLLLLALLGAGWLLKDTVFDLGTSDDATTAALDAEAEALAGNSGTEGKPATGPQLATASGPRRAANESPLSDAEAVAERALGVSPPSASVQFAGLVRGAGRGALRDVEIVAIGPSGTQRFKSDADGRFEHTLAAGRYDLLFRGEGMASLRRNFPVDGSLSQDAEFILLDTGTIVVTVLRGDEPVPGVVLQAAPTGPFAEMLMASATTGADGAARLEGLARGRYTVTGDMADGPQLVHKVSLTGPLNEATIRLPESVQFTGTVRHGKDGPAVTYAHVVLSVRPPKSAGTLAVEFDTAGDGTFDVSVPRGRPVSFTVQAEGFAPFPDSRKRNSVLRALGGLRRAKPVTYDIALERGQSIFGVVSDPDARPVPGVLLQIRRARAREPLARATTDDEGRYAFPHLAHEVYELGILTPGLFPARDESLRVRFDKEPVEKNIKILAARRISGRVVTTAGAGVPAARVWIAGGGVAVRSARDAGRIVEAYTSANGSFLLADLPSDRGLSIRASMGLEEATPYPVPPNAESIGPVLLQLKATGEIQGTVVDQDTREPLANVQVGARPDPRDGRTGKSARTGPDGTFVFRGLIPGKWKLTPRLRAYRPHVGVVMDVGAEESETRLELDPGVVFEGTTVTEQGKPLNGVTVTVRKVVDGKLVGRWTARSGGGGRFKVSGIDRGAEYRLIATRGGFQSVVQNGLRDSERRMRLSFRPKGSK